MKTATLLLTGALLLTGQATTAAGPDALTSGQAATSVGPNALTTGQAAVAVRPAVHHVTVNADGTFSPMWTYIRSGDVVEWTLNNHTDTVIRSTWSGNWPAICSTPTPYEENNLNEFTGPMPDSPGGLFSLSPNPKAPGWGLRVYQNSCGTFEDRGSVGAQHICSAAMPGATLPSTWADPAITGVFIRLRWDQIEPFDGVYDFYILDREINQAVANGKLYSLAFEAGAHGTPGWLFTSAGVTGHNFRDQGSNPDDAALCGARMTLGAPWDATYKQRYFDMLNGMAAHLKTRADWYRALAYVKPSGANLFTTENRLPNGCEVGCCNDREWSGAGYRPSLLEGFYEEQFDVIDAAFPGKAMSYELIQAGFPRINAAGGFVDENGVLTAGMSQLGAHAQTEAIIDIGSDPANSYHDRFAVQHCGLQPIPAAACPGSDGCPNQWVIDAGVAGQPTVFQTQNITKIPDLPTLDAALRNAELNSDATMVEIYEERVWEAQQLPGPLDPAGSGRDLAAWDQLLRDRRAAPLTYRHTFVRTLAGSGNQLLYYVNGTKCGNAGAYQYGVIVIQP